MTLREFLVKAKACGYATKGESDELELADGGKELSYREGEYAYRDRYYGFNPFVGEEVVWQDGRVVWAMNYYGRITSGSISSSEVYRFLQKVLREVKPDRPFRGPREFADSEFEYRDESEGDLARFSGSERISHSSLEIYHLTYHGGAVATTP